MLVDSVAGAFLLAGAVACASPQRSRWRGTCARGPGARAGGRAAPASWPGPRAARESPPARSPPSRRRCSCSRASGRRRCRGSTPRWAPPPPPRSPWRSAPAPRRRSASAASAAGLGLCRWRPGRAVLLALAGLAALGAGPWLAPARGGRVAAAAWLGEPPPEPGPEFSPVVLAAILTFATTALGAAHRRAVHRLDDVAVVLASLTVLAGMARAGLTVDRAAARDAARGDDRRPHRPRQPPPPRRHAARRDRVGGGAATSSRCC